MKTYKREAALVVLLYLFYLGLYGRIEALEVLAWPLMLFVGAAFGMEWTSKQTNLANRRTYSVDELDRK